jgi:hypothetical protein
MFRNIFPLISLRYDYPLRCSRYVIPLRSISLYVRKRRGVKVNSYFHGVSENNVPVGMKIE